MRKWIFNYYIFSTLFFAWFLISSNVDGRLLPTGSFRNFLKIKGNKYSLKDFYSNDSKLELAVYRYMDALTDREKVAQMLILPLGENGYSLEEIKNFVRNIRVGGIIFLKNDYKKTIEYVRVINSLYSNNSSIPPLFAIDGEPSLLHTRLVGVEPLPPAGSLVSERECREVALKIADILKEIGIQYNFAPVCDLSYNTDIIGNRSFGENKDHVIDFCKIFIDVMTSSNIVSTVKHFPGHGTIEGDTHGRLLYAEGIPPEIDIFKALIDYGVISVMVGHIAVKSNDIYNTKGKPSTLSRNMVTNVLKKRMGFKGLVVTDAMTMNAVSSFENPDVEAAKAGCDVILMPRNPSNFVDELTELIQHDRDLRIQIMESVKKIIKLKICLGITENNGRFIIKY